MARTNKEKQQIQAERRIGILCAAKNVFSRKGRSTTMADIAIEAGISQGLAYRYFESKEEIFSTLVKHMTRSGGGPAARIQKIQGTPLIRLHLFISYILEDKKLNPGFSQFFKQILADDTMPNELKDLIQTNIKIIESILRQLIIECQKTGEIAKDDPDQLIYALMACFDGLMERTSQLDPKVSKKYYPNSKIILRMLKPDNE